ncbi:methyltransferase domain-containing protein [Flavitalea flava]
MTTSVLSAEYWDDRYQNNNTGWDMGQVSPPLKTYFDQLPDKNISILIPGCGNSYEAGYLLENGFSNITIVDISALLTSELMEKFKDYANKPSSGGKPLLTIITGDFFELKGSFDLIVEQTFFCALDPSLRENYVTKMTELLNPGGKLAGVLFDKNFVGGPPFGGHKEEYAALFTAKFRIRTLEPCYNSIGPRQGTELFLVAERGVDCWG